MRSRQIVSKMPGNPRLSSVGMTRVEFAHDHRDAALLAEDVHAEPRLVAELIAAIARPVFEQVPDQPAAVAQDVEGDVFGLVGRQGVNGRIDRDRFELSERFHLERPADGKIQIGNAVVALEHGSEDGVEFYGAHKRSKAE